MIEENPMGKMLLDRLKLRWEDSVKKEFKKIEHDTKWREVAKDRAEIGVKVCVCSMVLKAETKKK